MVRLKTPFLPLLLMLVVAFSGFVALAYVLWQSQRPLTRTQLEQQVIEFLKTTDVKKAWNGNIEIKESYDHKLGGKVVVVEYMTTSAGHPDFMLEMIERHTAAITLNQEGEAISAFCLHGERVWDLLNQRWILQNP